MIAGIGDNVQYRNINTQDDGIITYYLIYDAFLLEKVIMPGFF